MGKIEKFFHNLPLRQAFIIYVVVFALLALFLSELSCRWANEQIITANVDYLIDISDALVKEVSDNIVLYKNPTPIWAENMAAVRGYQAVSAFAPVFLVCPVPDLLYTAFLPFYAEGAFAPVRGSCQPYCRK